MQSTALRFSLASIVLLSSSVAAAQATGAPPADKPADKPAEKTADKPAEKAADKPATATPPASGAKPKGATAESAGEKDKPKDAAGDKPKDGAGDKPKDVPSEAGKDKPAGGSEGDTGLSPTGEPLATNKSRKRMEVDKFGRTDDDLDEALADKPPRDNYYLGARFRDFIIPGFAFDLFVDGGPSAVNVFSGGPEFVMQNGRFVSIFSVTVPYADFSMDPFVFKSKKDPEQAYEMVESSLKLITASVDLLGRIPFDKKERFALLLGGGVGVSGVLGNINRTQAYPKDPKDLDGDDSSKWSKCNGPGDPTILAPDGNAYCGDDNDHYGGYSEPSWANGGSKPFIFPYIALPHIAFEVRPINEMTMRIDTGFSLTGFFFGFAAGGRLPI
jgi:hypothetical protein